MIELTQDSVYLALISDVDSIYEAVLHTFTRDKGCLKHFYILFLALHPSKNQPGPKMWHHGNWKVLWMQYNCNHCTHLQQFKYFEASCSVHSTYIWMSLTQKPINGPSTSRMKIGFKSSRWHLFWLFNAADIWPSVFELKSPQLAFGNCWCRWVIIHNKNVSFIN